MMLLSAHEKKLLDLQNAVEGFAKTAEGEGKKGCFGTLLYNADDPHCGECSDKAECAMAHGETKFQQMADLNGECAKIEASMKPKPKADPHPTVDEEQLQAEMEQAKAEFQPNPKAAEKKATAIEAPKSPEEIDFDEVATMKKSKLKVDWVAVIKKLVATKPADYKELLAFFKAYFPHLLNDCSGHFS